MKNKVRHLIGISGGKDSAALAIYMHDKYPELNIEYYFCDTGKELDETVQLVKNLEDYLGKEITKLTAIENVHYTPFDYFLNSYGGYLPSANARWCTKKLKLEPFETFVGSDPVFSYVGIRGDEDREGYISTKPNIQSIFPFRRNIWSIDVLNAVFQNDRIEIIKEFYKKNADGKQLIRILEIVNEPISTTHSFSRKINSLLDINIPSFNQVVLDFLKTTCYPASKLEIFPLVHNTDNLIRQDIFKILEDSGVGVPAYYNAIDFEVEGLKGRYSRSRSGCFFCFFQQKIEWVWLYEQHRDLFLKAIQYEKDGYTWMQDERLEDLIKPERINDIKLDSITRDRRMNLKKSPYLIDKLIEAEGIVCANCFI